MKKEKRAKGKSYLTGVVDLIASGAAYVVSPESVNDIYIPRDKTNHALDGDTVKVLVRDRHSQKLEGKIVEIIERGRSTYSGTIQVLKKYGFVKADASKMPEDIFIPYHNLNGAKDGQKVLVKITGWEETDKNPIGEVLEVLGQPGEHSAEMSSIIEEYGLPTSFPAQV
ncbi:MAG TPA: ribonuclease R, partial [Bacteroidia bacterium]|nr:ribonuclease R [Bacteroidia bacterium]